MNISQHQQDVCGTNRILGKLLKTHFMDCLQCRTVVMGCFSQKIRIFSSTIDVQCLPIPDPATFFPYGGALPRHAYRPLSAVPQRQFQRFKEVQPMLKRLVRALVLSIALLPFASMADQGQLRNEQTFGDWTSAIFHVNNADQIRMWAVAASSPYSFLVLDFDSSGENYIAQVIMNKQGDLIGTVISPNRTELNCELRVDTNQVLYPNCFFNDDNTTGYLVLGQGLGYRFINELKSGSILRIKIQYYGKEPFYDRFSLRGFSRSYSRAMSLTYGFGNGGYYGGGNDSDYFR